MHLNHMTQEERVLILEVSECQPEALRIIYSIYNLKRKSTVLIWLNKNKIRGQKLVDLYMEFNSPLFFYKYCLKKSLGKFFNGVNVGDLS